MSSTLHKRGAYCQADTLDDPKAVYALKDKLDATGALAHYAVTQVELAATVQVEGERPKDGGGKDHASKFVFTQT